MASDQHTAHIVAFGGGKGGVGKSLIAANVGIFLAQLGKRVILLDAGLGGANLHNFLGEERPRRSVVRLLGNESANITDCLQDTQIGGLSLLSLDSEDPGWLAPKTARRARLLEQIQGLECDFLVIDLAPVTNWAGLDLYLLAHCGVLVTLPEPASVEATYRFIVSAFQRRVRRLEGVPQLWAKARNTEAPLVTPLDLYQLALEEQPAVAEAIRAEIAGLRPRVVVNVTRSRADLELGQQLQSAGRRGLGLPVEYFGYVESDDAVLLAARKRRPVVVEHPESKFAKNLERIARRILADQGERAQSTWSPRLPDEQTYYEVLEAELGASEEELRRAYRRVREIFAPDAMAICGLFTEERLQGVQQRIQEAYDTLLDPARRHRYDLERFPEGHPARRKQQAASFKSGEFEVRSISQVTVLPVPPAGPAPPPAPEIGADTEFTGELLKRVREARGIEIDEIAQRTKITATHLRAIEAEQFGKLPAPVYVRGFVVELAKCLKLEPQRVAASYMKRLPAQEPEDPTKGWRIR